MKAYGISARFVAQPAPADWQEQLVKRLGSRPRRLGRWAELGLYGALECLATHAPATLAQNAALLLSSQHGPALAMRSAMAQAREGLPLPLGFLQTQPSQLLAALSAQLRWRGDARFITHPDPLALTALALAMADRHTDGLLLGWVNELQTESSVWLRLQPAANAGGTWIEAADFETVLQRASHVRMGPARLEVIIKT
jgi:hypothetical protein